MKKILINGNNYTSSYFLNFPEKYDVIYRLNINSDFKYLSEKYSHVVNFYEVYSGDFLQIYSDNFLYVKEMSEKCKQNGIELVQMSTADFYNKSHKWDENVEESDFLNLKNDYLISKRVCEKFLKNDHLILRTRNCFDERFHSDNWLVKTYNQTKISNMIDVFTYIPDLKKVLEFLLENKKRGIYNVVQQENGSDLYFFSSILKTPKFSYLDPHMKEHMDILNFENSKDLMCCDVNCSKLLSEYTSLTNLNAAALICWENLKNKFDIA